MDILSSQSNLAGYKSVLDAAYEFGRAFPMMMTAAGTVPPARVFIMGVGVAGLQAIATAKRLGAIVSATDVRPATKEQVESLGATFVAVEDEEFQQAQTEGGYAKEMSDAYKAKQAKLIADTIAKQDIVICTALIPGRPAPRLVSDDMLKTMKPGAVLIDLAVEAGGNVAGSVAGKVVTKHGVKIVGHHNVPGRIAEDASKLFARNLLNFLTPMIDKDSKALKIDMADEIVAGTLITRDGAIVHPKLAGAAAASASAKNGETAAKGE
jgi:NAD(P) transhydrogenase subunit alpha